MSENFTGHGNVHFTGAWKIGDAIYQVADVRSILEAGAAKYKVHSDETDCLTGSVTFLAGNGCSLTQNAGNNSITVNAGNEDCLITTPGADALLLADHIRTYLVEAPAEALTLDPAGLTSPSGLFYLRVNIPETCTCALHGFGNPMTLPAGKHCFLVNHIRDVPEGGNPLSLIHYGLQPGTE